METIKFIKTVAEEHKNNIDIKNIIKKKLFKNGILTTYDDNRMCLHSSKKKRITGYTNMQRECNGLVIDSNTLLPLAIPIPNFISNINTKLINSYINLNLYTVYPIRDGTIINLYYYDDKWCISSSRGYDVTNLKNNKLSYIELLNDVLLKGTGDNMLLHFWI